MALIGYGRVSTKGQSLEAQEQALTAYGVSKLYTEKLSGKSSDRPALTEMLAYVREGDTVVVTKLDRLARSTKDLLEIADQIEKKGAELHILNIHLDTSTPTGKLMLTMLGAVATFEREIMLERQAEGYAIAMAGGKIKGRPSTAKDQADQIKALTDQGMTRQAIADQLNIGIASVYRHLKG